MDNLYQKLELNSLDEWLKVSRFKVIQNGGKSLLFHFYSNDMLKLLSSVYPSHNWPSSIHNFNFNNNDNINNDNNNNQNDNKNNITNYENINDNLNNSFNNIDNNIINNDKNNNLNDKNKNKYKNNKNNFNNDNEKKTKIDQKNKFSTLEKQQNFMANLFEIFQLKTMENFKSILKIEIYYHGGRSLISHYYLNNYNNLLRSIFPNYPWEFNDQKNSHFSLKYFQSMENQRNFMENLFFQLNFNSLNDFLNLSIEKFKFYNTKNLLFFYSSDYYLLLRSIFPNYPWEFDDQKNNQIRSIDYFKSIENQRKFMDELFKKLKLNSFDDWIKITKTKLKRTNGKNWITFYYHIEKFDQLISFYANIYPNYPWHFHLIDYFRKKNIFNYKINFLLNKNNNLNNNNINCNNNLNNKIDINKLNEENKINKNKLKEQKEKMEKLFKKFQLKTLDDWLTIRKSKLNANRDLLNQSNNFTHLLRSTYPNYPWNFDQLLKNNSREYFNPMVNRRQFMDQLFFNLNLKSFNDWLFVSKNQIIIHNGKCLIDRFYNGDMKKLLVEIYPNFPWKSCFYFRHYYFDHRNLKIKQLNSSSNLIDNNNNDNINNIYNINEEDIKERGEEELNDLKEYQRKEMEKLFMKLNLSELQDWIFVTKFQILKNGGRKLLSFYSNNLKKLLTSLYPSFNWQFDKMKFRPTQKFTKSKNYLNEKLKIIIRKFLIRQKEDFYRLPNQMEDIFDLYSSLQIVFPFDQFRKSNFFTKSKKSNQRFLFCTLSNHFGRFPIFENYQFKYQLNLDHVNNNSSEDINPIFKIEIKLNNNNNNINNNLNNHLNNLNDDNNNRKIEKISTKMSSQLEIDIFIPSLNMGYEYQGIQHYEDFPFFGSAESHQLRDHQKKNILSKYGINIIPVPYWWDNSSSSLFSSISNTNPNLDLNSFFSVPNSSDKLY